MLGSHNCDAFEASSLIACPGMFELGISTSALNLCGCIVAVSLQTELHHGQTTQACSSWRTSSALTKMPYPYLHALLCTSRYWLQCNPLQVFAFTSEHLLQVEMMQLEVDAMQAEAASAREAAESSQAAVLEVERLGQDNSLLAARLSQMDLDLQVGCPYT